MESRIDTKANASRDIQNTVALRPSDLRPARMTIVNDNWVVMRSTTLHMWMTFRKITM